MAAITSVDAGRVKEACHGCRALFAINAHGLTAFTVGTASPDVDHPAVATRGPPAWRLPYFDNHPILEFLAMGHSTLPEQCLVMDRGLPDGRQFSLRIEVNANQIDYVDLDGWSLPEVVQAAYAAGFRPRHWVQISPTGSSNMIADIPLSVIPKT